MGTVRFQRQGCPTMAKNTKRANYLAGFEICSDDTVVDVGCFEGKACEFAGKLGADVIGIDIDERGIAAADERMAKVPARSYRGIVSDCNPIPLDNETASAIICTEVLEHVDDPAPFLA